MLEKRGIAKPTAEQGCWNKKGNKVLQKTTKRKNRKTGNPKFSITEYNIHKNYKNINQEVIGYMFKHFVSSPYYRP